MKKSKLKFLLFLLLLLVLVSAVLLIVKNNKANVAATQSNAVITSSPEPTIYIVPAPTENPGDYGVDVPSGVYIVGAPQEAQSNTNNSGIYIVDAPPEASSGGSGIYIIETPKPGGGSGGGGGSYGNTIASGSFSSSTGTSLNSTITYNAVTSGSNTVEVTVSVSLSHGQLSASGGRVLSVSVGGQSATINCPSINGSGSTYLGSHTFTVNLAPGNSTSLYVKSSWAFGGTYSGTYLSSVDAGGTIYLSR